VLKNIINYNETGKMSIVDSSSSTLAELVAYLLTSIQVDGAV
jgi:hypothetical protein